jgi:type IV secretion system protein VirB4
MKLFKRKPIKHFVGKSEISQSIFIPFKGHWDRNIVLTKSSELCIVIKVEGFAFETADDEDLDIKKIILNTLFKSIAGGNYALYFHIIRRREFSHVKGEFDNVFSKELNEKWNEKHSKKESFTNDLYITVIRKQDKDGAASSAVNMFQGLMKAADKSLGDIELIEGAKALRDIASRLMGSLKSYKPKLLGIRETSVGKYSEPLELFSMLLNGGEFSPVLVPTVNADKYVSRNRTYFGKRALETRDEKGKTKFGGAITIKQYPAFTMAGMLDNLIKLPFELIITHSYVFSNTASAISSMQLQQNRMKSAGDKAVSQMEYLSLAMDMAQSGEIAFGTHHFSIFVYKDSLEDLDQALSNCYSEIVNVGIAPYRETFSLQGTYWAQLPTNHNFSARGTTLNSLNLVGLCSLHNYPIGQIDGNHWGPAVTTLDTTSLTPFYFSFHVRDVGHTMIIGPTGAGKTVMMNFLCAQAQKFKPNLFFFDKDRGAEIFIRAIGGIFTILNPSGTMGFNPLQLEDTDSNREFLIEWLKVLGSGAGRFPLTPEDDEKIVEAVRGNFKLPKDQRRLRNVVPFLGLDRPGSVASRVRIWHSGDARAGIFDNPEDTIDFSVSKTFGFEMAPLLESGDALGPVLLYLFHRINMTLTGEPTMIVLDEAWALIDNEVFAPKIKNWLKVLRKLNGMVVFATQSPEDVAKSRISETLVQQTSTQIFLCNMKATAVYQDVLKLSNREFALIKFTDPGQRYFLVKQGEESVIARIDLSGMDDLINVLSGRAQTVLLLDDIRAEVGEDPEKWLPIFKERVRNV